MHIAFIMDGNGRWALRNGKTRAQGHEQGIQAANEIMMACVERKIPRATFYAFSVQNWSRDRSEIENIYTSGKLLFERMGPWVKEHNVVVKCVGSKFNLAEEHKQQGEQEEAEEENPKVKAALTLARDLMAQTANNTGTVITLCVSYGGREEILDVFRQIKEPLKSLTTTMVSDFFQIPDVDLVVRTSGEYRISNFLLWQSAYAEYYFTDLMWPEFTPEELDKAIASFKQRNRRFGALGSAPTTIPEPEDLKELYADLLLSFPTTFHLETDLRALQNRLALTHSFDRPKRQTSEAELRRAYQESTPASVGATNILLQLYDLPDNEKGPAFQLLSRAFTLESLDHVFRTNQRLNYIDTTKTEKQLLQYVCANQGSGDPFLNRIASVYYGLKLYTRHLIHEDALTLYAILLTVCGDIVERQFHQPYFDREDLKTLVFQVVRETLDLEKEIQKEVRDLLTFTCLGILFHYFEEPDPSVPTSALELGAFLGAKLKGLAAERFIEEHENRTAK
jgi:undecaprenyl diphosphate synthase